jgi:hypothetical protein
MKAIIYVQPIDAEAMDKWLNDDSIKLTPPYFWFEPLKSAKNRVSLVQLIISSDDLQKLLDAASKNMCDTTATDKQLNLDL